MLRFGAVLGGPLHPKRVEVRKGPHPLPQLYILSDYKPNQASKHASQLKVNMKIKRCCCFWGIRIIRSVYKPQVIAIILQPFLPIFISSRNIKTSSMLLVRSHLLLVSSSPFPSQEDLSMHALPFHVRAEDEKKKKKIFKKSKKKEKR